MTKGKSEAGQGMLKESPGTWEPGGIDLKRIQLELAPRLASWFSLALTTLLTHHRFTRQICVLPSLARKLREVRTFAE